MYGRHFGETGRLIEIAGEPAAILIPERGGWEIHVIDRRWSQLEGRHFETAAAAEHEIMLNRTASREARHRVAEPA